MTITQAREPWRAVNLSLVFPGLGQWDAGRRGAAALQAGAALILLAGTIACIVVPALPGWMSLVLAGLFVVLSIASMVDAHRQAVATRSPEDESTRQSSRDAWKTLFLNRFIPGLGHAYEGRWGGAVLWCLAFILVTYPEGRWSPVARAIVLGGVVCDGWAKGRGRRGEGGAVIPAVTLIACLTALQGAGPALIRNVWFTAYRIPSASMAPTLRPGDYVFASVRGFSPRRGDVVVYPFPSDRTKMVLKRVFGLAGDVIEFRADGAYRNGSRLMPGPVSNDPGPARCLGAEGHPYTVPGGQVFVVGDNLPNSNDSRFHGPVAVRDLRGRVYKIYWPPGRARALE